MQRVRIGLTGLCSVFLLVLLAAAIFGLTPAEKGVREPRPAADGNSSADDPKDPLAELGVTPGGSQTDAPKPADAPAPAPAASGPAPAAKPIP
jgi:hypothetical protein